MAEAKKGRGGARPGAGRKPKPKPAPIVVAPADVIPEAPAGDMLTLLQKVALGHIDATPLQVRAAIAAVQYTHTKRHDGGKKEEAAERAERAAAGKFGARPAPLKLVGNA